MLCREFSLVNQGEHHAIAIPLECRSWGCDYCQPKRQYQLRVLARSGAPNRFITLTHRPDLDTHRDRRAHNLAVTWRIIIKRARRQFALPPARRWPLKTPIADTPELDHAQLDRAERNRKVARICTLDDRTAPLDVAYLCVFEAHKSGEPHLHILFRGRYIPQDWLSEQCAELLNSPRCDIRKVHNQKQAAWYVSKYVGKAPHKFGTNKRYWHTTNYELHSPDEDEDNPYKGQIWLITEKPIIDIYTEWARHRTDITIEGNFDRISYGPAPGSKRSTNAAQWRDTA